MMVVRMYIADCRLSSLSGLETKFLEDLLQKNTRDISNDTQVKGCVILECFKAF